MKMKRRGGHLWRHRGYALLATTTLAMTIGLNVAVFTLVNALWLRPLPFREADRLVTITSHVFFDLDAPVLREFEEVAGQTISPRSSTAAPEIILDSTDRALEFLGVSTNYFKVLGLSVRGRDFSPADNHPGAEAVAIISDRMWSQLYGRSPEAIGSMIRASPISLRVIGVAPSGVDGARRGERADLWIPSNLVARLAAQSLDRSPLAVIGRTRFGESVTSLLGRLNETYAHDRHMTGLSIVPLREVFGTPDSLPIVIREGTTFAIVAGLAVLVLLGGSSTLAALVIVHYEQRRRELSTRVALGCSRGRLARTVLRELIPLFALGMAGAVAVASAGIAVVPSVSLPGGVNIGRLDLSVDWRVLAFGASTTLLVLALAAFWPVRRCMTTNTADRLLTGSATATRSSQRLRQGLLAVHVCSTIIVLVTAGLFVRAVLRGLGAGPGFDSHRTMFVNLRVLPPRSDLGSIDTRDLLAAGRTHHVESILRSLPGVEVASYGIAPIGADASALLARPQIVETATQRRDVMLGALRGSPNILSALGVPLLAGRGLVAADGQGNPLPAVITASLARLLWPNQNALGHLLAVRGRTGGRFIVVGVAQDFVFGSFARPAAGVVITTGPPDFGAVSHFIVRAQRGHDLATGIRRALDEGLAGLPSPVIADGRSIVMDDLGQQRLGVWIFSGFGFTALLLSVGGVFGLVGYLAATQRRECGIRIALGATPRNLVSFGVGAALWPVGIGTAAGLIVAGFVSRVIESSLAGINALDVVTYSLVGLLILTTSSTAAFLAARRMPLLSAVDALKMD
jgi:predicted permease